jgi:hypothetical protein
MRQLWPTLKVGRGWKVGNDQLSEAIAMRPTIKVGQGWKVGSD